jgi:hypothetical protein
LANNQILKTINNKPLQNFKHKVKLAIKQIEKDFKILQKANKKLNKLYINQLVTTNKIYNKYLYYKQKYLEVKQSKSLAYQKYLKNTRKKNKQIKQLKNQIIYLKSVISKIKSKLDKKTYQRYLQLYKKVKQ